MMSAHTISLCTSLPLRAKIEFMARKKTISDEAILSAAREVFSKRGFSAPTRDIARSAGISEGVLFQRYRTKADLFFAAMVPPGINISACLQTNQPDEPGSLPAPTYSESIHNAATEILRYFRTAAPILAQLSTHPEFRFDEFATRHPQSALVTLRGELVRFFAAHKAPDPSGAALTMITSLYGVAMFEQLGAHGGKFPDDFVERILGSLTVAARPAGSAAGSAH